jgi:hypothetical protein|tara:strand:+ start:373 stop:576 length:204 start_codon:yes stop_codon:yes gene_type:complete
MDLRDKNRSYKMTITKEQWEDYKRIQNYGEYNMLDPRARQLSDILTKEEWTYIIRNYSQLSEEYFNE